MLLSLSRKFQNWYSIKNLSENVCANLFLSKLVDNRTLKRKIEKRVRGEIDQIEILKLAESMKYFDKFWKKRRNGYDFVNFEQT